MSSRAIAIITFTRKHPLARGMLTYAVLWPTSNFVQQSVDKERVTYDWEQLGRFSLFGAFYTAPTVFGWVKIISHFIPGTSIKAAVSKALIEQVFYSPFAISSFYLGMSALEGKKWNQMVEELKAKFVPTYKTGFLYWPIVQTVNFAFVRERNRVAFVSSASFFWTLFLSYMKQLQLRRTLVYA